MKAVSLTAKILVSLMAVFFLSQATSQLLPSCFALISKYMEFDFQYAEWWASQMVLVVKNQSANAGEM